MVENKTTKAPTKKIVNPAFPSGRYIWDKSLIILSSLTPTAATFRSYFHRLNHFLLVLFRVQMTGRNRDLRFNMVKSLTIRHIRHEHGGRIPAVRPRSVPSTPPSIQQTPKRASIFYFLLRHFSAMQQRFNHRRPVYDHRLHPHA